MKGIKLAALVCGLFLFSACAQFNQGVAPTADSPTGLSRIMAQGELIVGTSGNQPPLNFVSRSGEVMGMEADIAQQIADAMGVKLRFQTMPFAELLPALESGKVDMVLSGMTMTPRRNMKSAFVGPYFVSGKAILTKEQALAEIRNPSEMDRPDLKLAALKGSTSQAFVEEMVPGCTLILAQDYDEAVQMVIKDQVDAFVADYPICIISVFRYPEAGLVSLIAPMTFEPLGIALPADDPLFVNWMENFVMLMEGSGELEELTESWFGDASWLEDLP